MFLLMMLLNLKEPGFRCHSEFFIFIFQRKQVLTFSESPTKPTVHMKCQDFFSFKKKKKKKNQNVVSCSYDWRLKG